MCYTAVKRSPEPTVHRMKIEIKKIGNSDGVILPRELMQRLDLKRGQQSARDRTRGRRIPGAAL